MMMINVPKILLPSELVKKQQYRQKRRYWESHLTCKKPIWDLMCGGIRGKVFNSEIGGGGLMERQYQGEAVINGGAVLGGLVMTNQYLLVSASRVYTNHSVSTINVRQKVVLSYHNYPEGKGSHLQKWSDYDKRKGLIKNGCSRKRQHRPTQRKEGRSI